MDIIDRNVRDSYTRLEEQMMGKSALLRLPINGSFELTPLCNMDCKMCYVSLKSWEMCQKGSLLAKNQWIEIAKEMKEAGTLFLLLTGGEPLTYPDFKEVYLALREMGFIITINTNGTLIDQGWADFFGKYPPRRMNITLYGMDNETYKLQCGHEGGFDQVIRGVKLLKERNVAVKLAGTMTPITAEQIDEMYSISDSLELPLMCDCYVMGVKRERGCDFDLNSRLSPENAAKVEIETLRKYMLPDVFREYIYEQKYKVEHYTKTKNVHYMNCAAGKCSFTINWQGMMRPCVTMSKPEFNVLEDGFMNCWKNICKETDKIVLNEKCLECKLKPICRVCASAAISEEGDYGAIPEYLCRYAHALYDLILENAERLSLGETL